MMVRQKLGMILENKVDKKFKLDNIILNKKWSPKLMFLNETQNEKNPLIILKPKTLLFGTYHL